MPTDLDLIKFEQIANTLFLIATFYAFSSGDKAAQNVIEKQENAPPSSTTSAAEESAQLALSSTILSVASYVIYLVVAVTRKNKLEQENQAGTSSTSITPIIMIALGFTLSLIGTIIRIPAIQQRIREAQVPVIL